MGPIKASFPSTPSLVRAISGASGLRGFKTMLPSRSSTRTAPSGEVRPLRPEDTVRLPVLSGGGILRGEGSMDVSFPSAPRLQAAFADSSRRPPPVIGIIRSNGQLLAVIFFPVRVDKSVISFGLSKAGRICPVKQSTRRHDIPAGSFQPKARVLPSSDHCGASTLVRGDCQYQLSYCFCHSVTRSDWAKTARGASSRSRSSMLMLLLVTVIDSTPHRLFLGLIGLGLICLRLGHLGFEAGKVGNGIANLLWRKNAQHGWHQRDGRGARGNRGDGDFLGLAVH